MSSIIGPRSRDAGSSFASRSKTRAPNISMSPGGEAGRLWTHQLQLTIADFVVEIHDAHHPIASSLYYEDQRKEARRRTQDFLKSRAPKYDVYFDRVPEATAG